MVNGVLPPLSRGCRTLNVAHEMSQTSAAQSGGERRRFAQILAKFDFLQLIENLRRILVDYAQKATSRANVAFKGRC
jgi:hypothetical protein